MKQIKMTVNHSCGRKWL